MKFIDAFTFYNEFDMLEYRLNVLDPFVDYFILVESTLTHRGKPKPLFYQENRDRFARFHHKIIHIVDEDLKTEKEILEDVNFFNGMGERKNKVWWNENHQRNAIDRGINQLTIDCKDLIIISDLDEIPDPSMLAGLKYDNKYSIAFVNLEMDMYYYNLTCKLAEKWYKSKIVSYDSYKNSFLSIPENIRSAHSQSTLINGGWHLSYFGDPKFIQNKLINFAHQEYNKEQYTDLNKIEERIKNGSDLFDREGVNWLSIPITENNYLPFRFEEYLEKYTGV